MQIFLTGRNLEVTEALRRYAEEKVGRLQRYLERITSAHIILSVEKYRQVAEVTLRVRDLTIRGEESSEDLYASIDLVVEKLERQVQKYKGKIQAHASRSGRPQGTIASREEEPRVVETKRGQCTVPSPRGQLRPDRARALDIVHSSLLTVSCDIASPPL
jgi:putative sigma-54 modulation protein